MLLSDACALADRLVSLMQPYCERIEVAGSIRRGKAEVKDIELVAIPKWGDQRVADELFERVRNTNLLHQYCTGSYLRTFCALTWIKTGTPDIAPWPIQPDGKYWRGYIASRDIKLDLFLCSPGNWGVIYLIRTGSAEFSESVMVHARRRGMRFHEGLLLGRDNRPIFTREERDVFEALALPYIEPADRTGPTGHNT